MDVNPPAQPHEKGRPFLGVRFVKCSTYGRLYLNMKGNAYLGRCPRCGAPVRVLVGEHGTAQRFFQAFCP
ncbi:MAG TPA: hypothetical protein VGA56_08160 [Opitutaceae bacterium]